MFLEFFSQFFFFLCVVICIGRADNTIEENNEDVPKAMSMQGQSFAVYESDSEDDELQFLDSFV